MSTNSGTCFFHDKYTFWSFWENIRTWWDYRHLPNIRLIHFNDLKQDLPGEMRKLAEYLDISIDESQWDAMVEHSTFDWMKANADLVTPMGGQIFEDGGRTFINKGVNKRWKDVLTAEDLAEYEARGIQELGEECFNWVRNGSAG